MLTRNRSREKIMANDNVKNVAKNGLPFLIVSLICGYATDAIPIFFPDGEFRDWAYRSVPFLSLILLFVIKTLKECHLQVCYLQYAQAEKRKG